MTTLPTPDLVIDCRGTYCPMPIIRLRQAIDDVADGAIVRLSVGYHKGWPESLPVKHFQKHGFHKCLTMESVERVLHLLI